MKVKVEKLPKSRVKLSITVERPEMDKYINATVKDLANKYTFKGFRKGEAPRQVIEQNLGSATLMMEAVETAINDSYMKAVMQEKIQPVGQAKVDVPEDKNQITKEEVFFVAEVDVFPDFELPDYKKKSKKFTKKEVSVSDKEVKDTVERILLSRAKHTPVTREAKKGDLVKFLLTINNAGEEIIKKHEDSLTLGDLTSGLKEFHEALEGTKTGETKSILVKLPKDFGMEKLGGKKVECELEVQSVTEVSLPAWDDKMVKELTGGKFGKVADMENNIREGLLEEKLQEEKVSRTQAFVEELIKDIKADMPDGLVDGELQNLLGEMQQKLSWQGMTMEQYYEMLGQKEEEFKEEMRPKAVDKLKMMLMLAKISDVEEIKAEDEAIELEMQNVLNTYPKEQIKDIDFERLRALVTGEMTDRLVVDFLTDLTQ